MPFDESINEELIRRITQLENDLAALSVGKQRYDIYNAKVFDDISADQDNFDIGHTEFIRMGSDGTRSITGFQGGVPGRRLVILSSTGNLSFPHNSGLSDAVNRIQTYTAATITIGVREAAYIVYFDSRWRLIFTS